MPPWLEGVSFQEANVWNVGLLRALLALISGSVVAWVYRSSRRGPVDNNSSFPATLVLLSVLIAVATQVIGDNVARAFGLAGALSVVRFRTVVRDTMDTAFVIFAVVVGMAAGAGQPLIMLVGLAVGSATAIFYGRSFRTGTSESFRSILQVKSASSEPLDEMLRGVLSEFTNDIQLIGASSIRQGTGMELTYDLSLLPDQSMATLLFRVSRIEGIISTEIKRDSKES